MEKWWIYAPASVVFLSGSLIVPLVLGQMDESKILLQQTGSYKQETKLIVPSKLPSRSE
jgi:hypothetical protein